MSTFGSRASVRPATKGEGALCERPSGRDPSGGQPLFQPQNLFQPALPFPETWAVLRSSLPGRKLPLTEGLGAPCLCGGRRCRSRGAVRSHPVSRRRAHHPCLSLPPLVTWNVSSGVLTLGRVPAPKSGLFPPQGPQPSTCFTPPPSSSHSPDPPQLLVIMFLKPTSCKVRPLSLSPGIVGVHHRHRPISLFTLVRSQAVLYKPRGLSSLSE